jgi:EmrB/QacA subfamily drug resistance transporter
MTAALHAVGNVTGTRRLHTRAALLVVGLTPALVVVDGIPVAVALPALTRDLGMSVGQVQWVVNGYTLAVAGTLLLTGRCADLFGRRRLLVCGLLTLTLATLVAGLSLTGPMLVLARVVQGVGAAMALPAAMAFIPVLFDAPARRDRAFASTAVMGGVAWVIGAVAGGVLTDLLGWRFVFLATVPFSLLALVLAIRGLPESRGSSADRRLDVGGAALILTGLTSILYGISQLQQSGPTARAFLIPCAVGIFLIGCFVATERRHPNPLVPLQLFRVRSLTGASLGVAANAGGYAGTVFVGTLYLQEVGGHTPTATGLIFLPLAVGPLLGPWLATWLERSGARTFGVVGLFACLSGLAVFAWLATLGVAPLGVIIVTMLVLGIGQHATWLAIVGQATRDVAHGQYGVASGVFKSSTHIGTAVAFAAASTIIEWVGGEAPYSSSAYAAAYVAIAVLTAAGAVAVGALIPGDRPGPTRAADAAA